MAESATDNYDEVLFEREEKKKEKAGNKRDSNVYLVGFLLVFFVMTIIVLGRSALNYGATSAPRLEIALGNRTCGKAEDYFTPFEYGLYQCKSHTLNLSRQDAMRLELFDEIMSCPVCEDSGPGSCLSNSCIPRHLAASYDSVAILTLMMGAWCARIKHAGDAMKSLDYTLETSKVAEWTHSISRRDAAASILSMLPDNNTTEYNATELCLLADKYGS